MSQFINKLLGREEESENHSGTVIKTQIGDNKQGPESSSAGGRQSTSRTVERDGVNIKSTISSDAVSTVSMANQQKLDDLISKLGSTHNEIDEYAKKQSAKINEEIQREINEVVARTRREQENLLKQANERTKQIDNEYRAQLQKMVEEIDAAKAKRIVEVEQELNNQQAGILQVARADIDNLNQKAANLKIGALQQAQERVATEVNQITAQAATLGQASTLHHAHGTTTIKTDVSAGTTSKNIEAAATTIGTSGAATSSSSESKTVETSRKQSSNESKRNN